MALYYLPLLVRSDRYFIAKLEAGNHPGYSYTPEFNFTIPADDRVHTPLFTLEDPSRISFIQMAPYSSHQDVLVKECHLAMSKTETGFELLIKKAPAFRVDPFEDHDSGIRLDYSESQQRVTIGYYRQQVDPVDLHLTIVLGLGDNERRSAPFLFSIRRATECHRVVVDFGSEASQVAYKSCAPQSPVVPYDILENLQSRLNAWQPSSPYRKEDFLNYEPGQQHLYRSFYAVRKTLDTTQRAGFPFNFSNNPADDEIRLFITRGELAATQVSFRDNYEIIPNLKLGIDKNLQLTVDGEPEEYSIRLHKKELISAVLLRILRLMISSKPEFRRGGLIVTLLVPNIYTQYDVFSLLNELRHHTPQLLDSLKLDPSLCIEYETISESDAAFMGFQQTHGGKVQLSNGEMALVIDCGKGTTDISILLADDNENYSSFFRTGFAGAGNVLSYGFTEDFLALVLNAMTGRNEPQVREFISRHILDQHLTVDVLNFIQMMEDQKKHFATLHAIGLPAFAELSERSQLSERTIGNLHRDPATLLQYAYEILHDRSIRWDETITGLIGKATDCIVHSMLTSIRDVITRDVRKRIRVVMLSGRAFYFDALREKLQLALKSLLDEGVEIHMVLPGRTLNNKNVAIYGAFTGAYKISDFTGIPVDSKEGLSRNRDILNNNMHLYRGIKIEAGNDILYNTAIVRRNHHLLKPFRNKAIDVYFTRDNIYLRLMENQQVKDVRSLYSVLTPLAEINSPLQDMKAISMFPNHPGDMVSIVRLHEDMIRERQQVVKEPARQRKGILQFFQF